MSECVECLLKESCVCRLSSELERRNVETVQYKFQRKLNANFTCEPCHNSVMCPRNIKYYTPNNSKDSGLR